MKINLLNELETEHFGAVLWAVLPKQCLVFLNGDLGAGKTTITRGVLRAAGHMSAVKSPTYTLVEEYDLASGKFFHFDLYRLKDPEELEWIGIQDYLAQPSPCFIEWPDLGKGYLPMPDIELTLTTEGEGRIIKINVLSDKLEKEVQHHLKNNDILL